MSKKLIQKNLQLSMEFDTFVSKHPSIFKSFPRGVNVVITSTSDKKLSEANLKIARDSRSGQFVIASKTGSNWKIESLPRAK